MPRITGWQPVENTLRCAEKRLYSQAFHGIPRQKLCFSAGCWVLLFAVSTYGIAVAADAPANELSRILKQLGDADPLKRLAAIEKIISTRDGARSALEAAAKSEPPELRSRAALLLNALATEPYLAKALKKLDNATSLDCDFTVTRTHGSFKGHFKGLTGSERFISEMVIAAPTGEVPMRIVGDGTTVWSESQPVGAEHKVVQKYVAATMLKMGTTQHLNPMDCVRDVRSRFCFTEMRVDKSSGTEMVVFEGGAKDGALERQVRIVEELGGPSLARTTRMQQQLMDHARIWFVKEGLALQKIEIFGTTGEPLFTMTLTHVNLDQTLDDAAFTYSPPKGVSVVDMDEQLKIARERDGVARP